VRDARKTRGDGGGFGSRSRARLERSRGKTVIIRP